jgi:hypothetical protein
MNGLPDEADFELSTEAVRERFDWELRQGHPQWLWPETTPSRWRSALGRIETAAQRVLAGRPATLAGNSTDIGIAAYTSGLGPLLGYWAHSGLLGAEPPVRSILDLHYRHNGMRMKRLASLECTAVEALADDGVAVTVLKGMDTAYRYFPVPAARPLSDIDLLIGAADEARAAIVLGSLGYRPGGQALGERSWHKAGIRTEPRTLSFVHRDDPWSIDLHTTLDRRYSAGAPLIRIDRAIGFAPKIPWRLTAKGRVLDGPAHVLHLAFHASLGFASLSMLRMVELVFVIRTEGRLDWDAFLALAARTGNSSCVYPALRFANAMAPGTVPASVLAMLERDAPVAVRKVIANLTPATCQPLARCSFRERFMWTATAGGWLREMGTWLLPPATRRELWGIYRMRFWRLARGTVSK